MRIYPGVLKYAIGGSAVFTGITALFNGMQPAVLWIGAGSFLAILGFANEVARIRDVRNR